MIGRPVILFGGKGGVGKTTCSAAAALRFASLGQRTLIITSDMTPSLSDVFEERIGDSIKKIADNLDAFEISQEAIAKRWKTKFGRDFYDILSHIIDIETLDSESRHQLLDYIGSAPSLREEAMLDLIVDMAESGGYDRIVWDTAPAGETLNLLGMPKNIKKHLRAGARVFEGLDKIGKQLIGKRAISDIMGEWILASEKIARYVRDKSAFIIVAVPESLVVNHVRRLMRTLNDYKLEIHGMIINLVVDNQDSMFLKAMSEVQAKYMKDLKDMAAGRPVAILRRSVKEIKGMIILREIGEMLVSGLSL